MRRIVVATLFLAGCALTERMRWDFVQSVGGIAVEAPVRTSKGVALPVRADVSGLTTVTVRPTTANSGLVCSATHAKVSGQNILIEISASVFGDSRLCPPARLGKISAGKYNVYYGKDLNSAILLGEVQIPP